MRRLLILLILFCGSWFAFSAQTESGKIIKVLPQFLDQQGRHTKSPSLYDRDAYQAWLRRHPEERSGISYAVQWKAKAPAFGGLKLKLELRGIAEGNLPRQKTIEKEVKRSRWFSTWSRLNLQGEDYKQFGEVTAWRVTLWDGDTLLDEQKSFLW